MSADVHLFGKRHVLLPNGNRIYELDAESFAALTAAPDEATLTALGLDAPPFVDDTPLADPPLRAISLAVAQKCNLGCTYCYAQQGDFGGAAKNMPLATAIEAIDLLPADERVNIAFLGGEPLINRDVVRRATEYAAERSPLATFSITTNGTLLREDDAEFFEQHAFAVTISIDGIGAAHDAQRPFKSGRGSFDELMSRVEPLLRMQRRMQVSARVTVTPRNLALRETLDELLARGFHSVGFSPMLTAPPRNAAVPAADQAASRRLGKRDASRPAGEDAGAPKDEMHARDLERMLAAMIECGDEFRRRTRRGERYAFANLVNALRELDRGTHRPYPCGAGASYLGVSADGELAACHRFVGDEAGAMGDLASGTDRARQSRWLEERHVMRQEPCRSCWARYLCGGGCHHEVIQRGRPACDYIRGWLHYCLETYAELGAPA